MEGYPLLVFLKWLFINFLFPFLILLFFMYLFRKKAPRLAILLALLPVIYGMAMNIVHVPSNIEWNTGYVYNVLSLAYLLMTIALLSFHMIFFYKIEND